MILTKSIVLSLFQFSFQSLELQNSRNYSFLCVSNRIVLAREIEKLSLLVNFQCSKKPKTNKNWPVQWKFKEKVCFSRKKNSLIFGRKEKHRRDVEPKSDQSAPSSVSVRAPKRWKFHSNESFCSAKSEKMLRLRFCRSLSHFRPELTLNGISKELSAGKVEKKSVFDQKVETEKMKTKIGSCKSQDEMVSVLVQYRNVSK